MDKLVNNLKKHLPKIVFVNEEGLVELKSKAEKSKKSSAPDNKSSQNKFLSENEKNSSSKQFESHEMSKNDCCEISEE